MSDTESFKQAMAEMVDKVASPYWIAMAARMKAAHDREIRDVSQREFARGFNAGKHSMDAEHRAVAMRLRRLPLDGGSHENLSQIARAVYHADFGWTQGACASLRDELVRLMGGVIDERVHVGGLRCDDSRMGDVSNGGDTGRTHDSPSNLDRDHMAVREGVDTVIGDSDDTCACAGGGACAAGDCDCTGEQTEVTDERLADDCGADTGCGDGGGGVHMAGLVAYDVLVNERRKAIAELRNMTIDSDYHGNYQRIALAIGTVYDGESFASECVRDRLIHLLGGDQPSGIDVLRGADLSKKSVDAMSSRAEGQSQDDTLMRVRLNAKTYAYQILELADILGVDVNVGDNVADIGNAVMAKARHLADERNFSTPENDMDTEDAKPNPAETSDDEIDHVSFGTRSITNGTTGQPNGTCPDDVPMASITDELREWASDRHCKGMSHTDVLNIGLIADRIDARHYLTSAVAEASTSDAWIAMSEYDKLREERDELRTELEELRGQSLTCPKSDEEMSESAPSASITDELRECVDTASKSYDNTPWYDVDEGEEADHTTCHITEGELLRIADSIDEQFGRICHQQEAVLQETIAEVVEERDHWHQRATDLMNRADAMKHERDDACAERDEMKKQFAKLCVERADLLDLLRDARDEYKTLDQVSAETSAHFHVMRGRVWGLEAERDELQAKLDEYDQTHVELPSDANGEVFRVGCTVRMVERHPEVLLTVHSMTMCDDGVWRLLAWDDEDGYSCNLSSHEFEVCDEPRDTAESIVRDLSMGAVTESVAIKRIEALND